MRKTKKAFCSGEKNRLQIELAFTIYPMKDQTLSRRNLMKLAGGVAVTAALSTQAAKAKRGVKKGRINQIPF